MHSGLLFAVLLAGIPLLAFGGEETVAFVKRMESFRGTVYRDSGGKRTIGYGATSARLVGRGGISKDEALMAVRLECQRIESRLSKEFGDSLKGHEEIALVSFVYNVGWTGFRKSRMFRLLKAGHRGEVIAVEFGRWVFVSRWGRKIVSKGLRARRKVEAAMFLHGRDA